MSMTQLLTSSWTLEPWVLVFALVLMTGYGLVTGFRLRGKSIIFSIGVLIMLLAVISPLDYLGRYYLFRIL